MNKGLLSFLSIIVAIFIGAIYYSNTIQSPFISSLNYLKTGYLNSLEFTQNSISKHFFQSSQITQLQKELAQYKENHLVMQQLASEITELTKENNSQLKIDPKVELVRTISYQKFSNFNRVWMEIQDYNNTSIYGLTHQELVAGIVIPHNNRPLALLIRDPKSAYAVYVGKENAPGIARGDNSENIIVDFIPAWFSIKKDDEVITSGLDKIFFNGLKVGKVLSVTKANGFQTAIISPYYKSTNPNYFHMIKEIR